MEPKQKIEETRARQGEAVSEADAPARSGAFAGEVPGDGATTRAGGDGSQRGAGPAGADAGAFAGEVSGDGATARADGEAADAEAIEGELDELVKTAAERDQYLALAQRTQADFENYRKRVARDAAAAQERGVAKLAKELLPALDNLDRAIEAATLKGAPHRGGRPEGCKQAAEDEDPLLAGVRLVRSELSAALARLGIEAFAPLGEAFDPNLHEAVAQQPVEGATSGDVAEVFQNGYRMGETIIRPARVLVAA